MSPGKLSAPARIKRNVNERTSCLRIGPAPRRRWPLAVVPFVVLLAVAGGAVPALPAGGPSLARQVAGYIGQFYVEPERVLPAQLVAGALLGLERRFPEATATVDAGRTRGAIDVAGESRSWDLARVRDLDGAAAAIDEMVDFVSSRSSPQRDGENPAYAAIRGALETLDPHTRVLTPADLVGFSSAIQGAFGGIGVTFDPAPAGILVREVLPGTPAARGGIAPRDLITAVDTVPLAGLSQNEVRDLVRGTPGSTVALTIVRGEAGAPIERRLVREVIRERSVRARLIRDGGAPVLLLSLERFQADTAAQLKAALAAAGDEPAGIVLDLRGNPGGLLDQALEIADVFLDDGVIVSTRDRNQREKVYRAGSFGVMRPQPPLVALINRGSASAAEVVAAALQPSRGLLIGETSFGKGSVQQLYPLSDGGGLVLTIRHYQTPGGVSIQSHGVEPDVLLRTVVVGARVVFGVPSVHAREAQLPNAFAGAAPGAAPGARLEVSSLRTSLDALPAPGQAAPAGAAPARGDGEDVALRAALAVVRGAAWAGGPSSRAAVLAAAAAVLPGLAAEETQKIEAALGGQGVDWSAARAAGGPPADLRAELPESVLVPPGESTRVTIRVRNAGAGTAHRVWGRTSSANPALANIDFAFGLIPPGESREASSDVRSPGWSWRRWDSFALELHEGDTAAGSFTGGALSSGGTQPALSYTVRIGDGNAADPGLNSDGHLERGERVSMLVRVSGSGDPGDLAFHISPDPSGGLTLSRREAAVGVDGGGREATFDGLLASDGPPAAVRLDVSLSSGSFGPVLSDWIDLPLGVAYPALLIRQPPLVTSEGAVPERTSSASLELRFSVADETSVKDAYVLVDGRKVLYLRGGKGAASLPVGLNVSLVPGSNRIEVVARDGDDLTSRRTWFVYRVAGR